MAVAAAAECMSPFAATEFAPAFAEAVAAPIPAVEWRDADAVAGLRLAREAARDRAQQILEERVRLLGEDPETAEVPNPVDPLTTAGRALEAKRAYGADSPEFAEARTSLVHDCARLFAEAYRKRRWEYFPELEQTHNDDTGGYEFMGYSLSTMVEQGLTPLAEEDEQMNRTAEFVEEATYKAVRGLGSLAVGRLAVLRPARRVHVEAQAQAGPETRVVTISECPDWAIAAFKRKSRGGWGGYAPEEEKLMIRGVRFANTGSRFQEQLGLPGTYITHDVVVEGLRRMRVAGPDEAPTKEDVRRRQLLNLNGKDVFAVAGLLDAIASKRSGKRIFLGEQVGEDHPRDYTAARAEAAERQHRQQADAEGLADFLMMLEANGTDHWVAQGIVERQVHKLLFRSVKNNTEAAAAAFDDKTAERLEEAQRLRAAGHEAAAQQAEAQAEKEAPAASFCGAGSCGLEEGGDSDEANSMREKLEAEEDEQLLRDTERPCKNCGKKKVWYAFNERVVKKACSSCGTTDIKKTK